MGPQGGTGFASGGVATRDQLLMRPKGFLTDQSSAIADAALAKPVAHMGPTHGSIDRVGPSLGPPPRDGVYAPIVCLSGACALKRIGRSEDRLRILCTSEFLNFAIECPMKSGVYIDVANLAMNGGFGMRYEVLRQFASRDGAEPVRLNAYVSFDPDRAEQDTEYRVKQNRFHAALRASTLHTCRETTWLV